MLIAIILVAGLILGSFVNALVWRLHAQSVLKPAKKTTKKTSKNLSVFMGRSMCPDCHHVLAAKDLVPVLSWLALSGKCRYCGRPISAQYPLVEILTAGLFILSFFFWPEKLQGLEVPVFALWLGVLTNFMALAVYDFLYQLLPNILVVWLFVLSLLSLILEIFAGNLSHKDLLLGALWGVLLLAGLFYGLFQISKGKLIGGGDVKLGVPLGILVGGPLNAILLLFVASTSGTLYSFPLLLKGQAAKDSRVPFGPFLILAAILVRLFGALIINWYKNLGT